MSSKLKTILYNIDKRSVLFESYSDSDLIKVPEGMMRVSGVIAKMDVLNNNGRFYTKENYTKKIDSIQDKIEMGLYGEMEHPESFNINYNNASHKIEKLWYDYATDEVKTIILLLDTEKGKIAQSIIKSGGILRCSTRCSGSTNSRNEAIIDKFYTIDLVGTPGFAEAKLYLNESENYTPNNSLNGNHKIIESNTNFIIVTDIKDMLLESIGVDSVALLESLNKRTDIKSIGKASPLYESIKSKIIKS